MSDEPTPEQVAIERAADVLATSDLVMVAPGIAMTNVHLPSECEGRGCWVHHPSDHQLAEAPLVIESATRVFRRCEHGTLHNDFDAWAYSNRYAARYSGMPPFCCPDETDCACCRGVR